MLETPFALEEYAMAVKKGNTSLLNKVNDALGTLKENGKYDEIYDKYFTTVE